MATKKNVKRAKKMAKASMKAVKGGAGTAKFGGAASFAAPTPRAPDGLPTESVSFNFGQL